MKEQVFHSKEITKGEYTDLYTFLNDELKLFKRSFLSLKHIESGEKQKFGLRYFEREYQPQVLELFDKNDFEAILSLPVGEYGRCATQMECRYIKSGNLVGMQIVEARPHEDGRTVALTPAKVFVDTEAQKLIKIAEQVEQK